MKNTLKNTAIKLGRNAKKTARSLGLAGLLTVSALSIFSPRNTYADSVDEDQKQDPIGDLIKVTEARLDGGRIFDINKHYAPDEIAIAQVIDPAEIESVRLDIKQQFGIDAKKIGLKKLRSSKSEFANYIVSSSDFKGQLVKKLPLASTIPGGHEIYFFEEPIKENLEDTWEVIHTPGAVKVLLPKDLQTFINLLRMEYEGLPEEMTKENFVKAQMNINDPKSYIRDLVAEHEWFHEKDPIQIRREERAFINRLMTEGNDYFDLSLVERSEVDVSRDKFGGKNENNLATLKIKRFYDQKIKGQGYERYEELSREQIRSIATDYARQEFPELLTRK